MQVEREVHGEAGGAGRVEAGAIQAASAPLDMALGGPAGVSQPGMHVFFATTSALLLPLGVRTRHLWALNVEPVSPSVDLSAAERAAGELLTALGADLGRESLRETPRRIATLYSELLTPAEFDATTFPGEGVQAFWPRTESCWVPSSSA